MFGKFYGYLIKNVINKKSMWVVNGLVWLFFALIFFIIPAPLHVSPLFLWSNSMFNFNLMTVIFLSIYCSILAVCIFNQPREDGTELIIFSKPIARWKIINVKFLVYLTFVFINTIVSMILPLFCLCLGKYDPVTNPDGFDVSKLASLELSIFIATLVICLFFGSIAILISMRANKPVIMVSTIAIAIVFELISMVMPMIVKSPSEIATDRYGIQISTTNYYDRDKNRARCFMTANDGILLDDTDMDHNTYEWNNIAQKASGLQIINSIDIGGQMASMYQLLKLNNLDNADLSMYGANSSFKFIVDPSSNVFDYYDPKIDTTNPNGFFPIIYPKKSEDFWGYTLYGIDQMRYSIYEAIGCKPSSVFIIDDVSSKLSSKFIDAVEFAFTDPNGKNIIQESKDSSGKYQPNGAQEYADLRNKFINYILGNGSIPYQTSEEGNNAFFLDLYKFLCNPLHKFGDSSKVISETGIEAVTGKKLDEIDNKEFSVALAKVSLNIAFELWDLFYGRHLEKYKMSSMIDDSKNWFIDKLVSEWEDREWTLYNKTTVSKQEFFKDYRFLFYSEFLNAGAEDIQKSGGPVTAYGRFYKIIDLKAFTLKNIDGFKIPLTPSTPKVERDASFDLNTMRNNISSIRELRSAYWYKVNRYVTNEQAIVIWLIFSLALFGTTFVVYRRTDIK